IELAGEINEGMPYYVLTKLQRLLNRHGRCLNGADILILGVTYKADVADWRETPAIKVMELLQREGAKLAYADPFTPSVEIEGRSYAAVEATDERLSRCACALLLTAHSAFDFERIVRHAPLVFDTRNGTRHVKGAKDNVVLL
ncbi:MAG: UDP-N-acetyl-D-glucosamine dehydrogenase, partial [Nitrospirae bacterium]|nr:UDP-N-acetyl-D-glucosamine dehydrogenase [Nitrospirota bacterium]